MRSSIWRAVVSLVLGLVLVSTGLAGPVISVRDHGAVGDGVADDTSAIQAAIDSLAGQAGTIDVPRGVYQIDAQRGVQLRSRTTLRLAEGAVLEAIPNRQDHYHVLKISDVEQVKVTGGVIAGERDQHTGKTGEWGNGIDIRRSKKVTLEKLTVRNCWGDGVYIGDQSSEVTVDHVIADRNRRQGLSVTSGTKIEIRDSTFQNTQGTAPECGVDIEPNAGETVAQCRVLRCQFLDNAGGGLQVGPALVDQERSFVREFVAEENTFERNGTSPPPNFTIQISSGDGAIIRNNILRANGGIGIGVNYSRKVQILGNHVTGTRWTGNKSDSGILVSNDDESVVQDNIVERNEGYGIFIWKAQPTLSNNQVSNNAKGNYR